VGHSWETSAETQDQVGPETLTPCGIFWPGKPACLSPRQDSLLTAQTSPAPGAQQIERTQVQDTLMWR
jgi:hypothetical protein